MSVTCSYRINATVVETLSTNVQGSVSPQVTHSKFDRALQLDGDGTGGTAPITQGKGFTFTLSGGALTIDLTSLPATGGGTFSATGLRLIVAHLECPATNAGAINIAPGASNGYYFLGSGNDFTIPIGGLMSVYTNNQGIDIDGTHKTLDLSGTGADILNAILCFG